MTFSSLVFLFIFLPIVFVLYVICRSTKMRNILLIIASLFFYAFGEPKAVIIMIISIILNYFFGIMCTKSNLKKLALVLAVILNIGLLIVFKYLGFFVETFDAITGANVAIPNIALPIGISFFTFQGLSYVIDVYRDKRMVQRKLLYVFLYISFFPQLIAGPIVKYHDIKAQLNNRKININRVYRGLNRFIIGLSKKVIIANQMGYMADLVFNSTMSDIGTPAAWIGALCYTFQIYFDFSGYSDMAIGLGCIFGFDFMENFNYPLISGSIKEFWRRWHISLSTWFKEYVYIPLGGNRKGAIRTYFNKLVVFFLTGFWHGANLTFIVWGLAHGAMLVVEGVVTDSRSKGAIARRRKRKKPIKLKVIGLIYTFLFVVLAFVIFRADNVGQGFELIANMFNGNAGDAGVNAIILGNVNGFFLISALLAVVFATPIVPFVRKHAMNSGFRGIYRILVYIITILMFALCVIFLISSAYNPFIYFRF